MKIPVIALTAIFTPPKWPAGDEGWGKELGWAAGSPFAKSIAESVQAEQQTSDLRSV